MQHSSGMSQDMSQESARMVHFEPLDQRGQWCIAHLMSLAAVYEGFIMQRR